MRLEFENGYLDIEDGLPVELINEEIINGTIWDTMSKLYNEYAKRDNKIGQMAQDLDLIKSMLKTLEANPVAQNESKAPKVQSTFAPITEVKEMSAEEREAKKRAREESKKNRNSRQRNRRKSTGGINVANFMNADNVNIAERME